ncbi:MAG: MotA/TolQ/ExbB proton channel family protein [Phascolarctobacterium sp.]|nr:MotA/TolQ/ExbB proton channel family protein [Phascolarctobacterium sp.]
MSIFAHAVDYFMRGGPCMWPLLFCSMMALVIGFERLMYYRTSISPDKFVVDFRETMNELKTKEALVIAENSKGTAAELAKEMLTMEKADECLGIRYEAIVYGKTDRIIDAWEKRINYLEVIVGLSPMLGLLGTITGMIASFNALNDRLSNPLAVTAGIGEALITTVFGLIISIMGMCIHSYLSSMLKDATLGINEVADVLVNIHTIEHHDHI